MFRINFAQYSKWAKIFAIIPVVVGILSLADLLLPLKPIKTKVISKDINYRAKFDRTTYNIRFENNNDQFTKEIYEAFTVGDDVILHASYFHEETSKIENKASGKIFENSTDEVYFHYLFTIIFLLPALAWFKKRSLSSKQVKYLFFILLFSLLDLYRILK